MPKAAYPGSRPMQNVAPAIMKTETVNDHLRPFLSPMLPQKIAPMGRSKNDKANTANVWINANAGSSFGKNTCAITTAKYEYVA